jgi:hypothetical protein
MTVAKTHNRKDYVGNGTNLIFAFDFKIYDETDLLVYVAGALKILNTDYTVSGGPTWTESGGNVTFVVAPPAASAVLIYRDLTVTQGTHWPEGDPFPSASHENAADRLVMLAQQFKEAIGRVFKVVITSLLTEIEIPEGAGKLWGWNALGTGAALYNQIIDTGVITTKGDLVIGNATGIAERKAIGTAGQIATVASGTVTWADRTLVKLDDAEVPDDNTDLNVSITKHGLAPKLPNDATKYLNGIGGYTVPPKDFSKIKFLATPAQKISWTALTDWTDVDISADTGGDIATAAILAVEVSGVVTPYASTTYMAVQAQLRKNGSSETDKVPKVTAVEDTEGSYNHTGIATGMIIVELDGGEIFEVKFANIGSRAPTTQTCKVNLMGYII